MCCFFPGYLDEGNWWLYFSLNCVKLIYIEKMLLLQQLIFNGVKITLFFGTFKWHIKVMLLLRCFLDCHCDLLCIMWQLYFSRFLKHVFLITLDIRCLLVCSYYVWKYDTITLCIGVLVIARYFVLCDSYIIAGSQKVHS